MHGLRCTALPSLQRHSNSQFPEFSPCSNFTTRFWRAEPVRCDRGFDGLQEQPTECLPPVPSAILYHTADFRPNSSSELLHCSNTEIFPIPITDLERSTCAGLNTPPEPCQVGGDVGQGPGAQESFAWAWLCGLWCNAFTLLQQYSGISSFQQLSLQGSKFTPAPRFIGCLLYTSPSPRDQRGSRMPSSA